MSAIAEDLLALIAEGEELARAKDLLETKHDREMYRSGFDAAMRRESQNHFVNGPIQQALAVETVMLRVTVAVLSEQLASRDRMVEHYRDLAATYAAFCADYRAMLEGK